MLLVSIMGGLMEKLLLLCCLVVFRFICLFRDDNQSNVAKNGEFFMRIFGSHQNDLVRIIGKKLWISDKLIKKNMKVRFKCLAEMNKNISNNSEIKTVMRIIYLIINS